MIGENLFDTDPASFCEFLRVFTNFGGDKQNYCLLVLNFVKIAFSYRIMFVILLKHSNL